MLMEQCSYPCHHLVCDGCARRIWDVESENAQNALDGPRRVVHQCSMCRHEVLQFPPPFTFAREILATVAQWTDREGIQD